MKLSTITLVLIGFMVKPIFKKGRNDNDIFYKYQPVFKNNYSTDLFLSSLNDKILKGFYMNQFKNDLLMSILLLSDVNEFHIKFLKRVHKYLWTTVKEEKHNIYETFIYYDNFKEGLTSVI